MKKTCPRCTKNFECKVENIAACHCSSITLATEEQGFISKNYSDCLCNSCLKEIQQSLSKEDGEHLQEPIHPSSK